MQAFTLKEVNELSSRFQIIRKFTARNSCDEKENQTIKTAPICESVKLFSFIRLLLKILQFLRASGPIKLQLKSKIFRFTVVLGLTRRDKNEIFK